MEIKDIFERNKYFVPIKKCCASCAHCQPESEKLRICDKGEGIVSPKSFCLKWEMKEGLQNAGKGGGKILKLHYIDYRVRRQDEDNVRMKKEKAEGLKPEPTPLDTIIREYEAEFGSRFINNF